VQVDCSAAHEKGRWATSAELRFRVSAAPVVRRGVILAVAVSGLIAPSGDQALASPVTCGQTITTDTTLDSDLTNCPGDGLVIAANDLTLNLNGHRISGTGSGVGIRSSDEGVKVVDGFIENFSTLVELRRATHNVLSGVAGYGDEQGVVLIDSDSNALLDSYPRAPVSLSLTRSSDNQILRNRMHSASISDGSNGNTVAHTFFESDLDVEASNDNRISENGWFYGCCGLRVGGFRNQVEGNNLHRGGGILIEGRNARVESNAIQYGGITVRASRSTITQNSIANASAAIVNLGGSGNRIEHNTGGRDFYGVLDEDSRNARITDNLFSDGRYVNNTYSVPGSQGVAVVGSTNAYVAGNTVSGNEDGIHVNDLARGTRLERNLATENTDDGIDVESVRTLLLHNHANSNGDFGIEAVPGVRAAGNTASDNGNPLQCLNVFCK
jgi:parallel beta-helix repeat protein